MKAVEPEDGPVYLTRLVGREEELRSLTERIWEGHKLVTLFGPPGVGKTRLASEALRASRATGLNGYFCDLLDARTEEDVASRVLRSIFHGAQTPKGDPREAVIAALSVRGPTCVVVLDNFEHLTRVAADLVSKWAKTCDGTTFLVTSRELLHVPGELAHELVPLVVPTREEDLEAAPATALLLDAIGRYRSTARVEAADRGRIRELAERLDGLPLALEIVAPRVALLGVSLVHDELDRILASPHAYANAPGRSTRTLRDTIVWSWQLLSPNEQTVLAQSTVFRGGFTVEALEAVSARERVSHVLEALMSLRDKSLVHASPTRSDTPQFGVYASIRQFASERLDELGLVRETKARHRHYFAGRARKVTDDRSAACMEMMREDRNEFIAAIERACATEDDEDARTDALTIFALLATEISGPRDQLVALFERTLARFVRDDVLSARALYAWGRISIQLDQIDRSREAFQTALRIAQEHSERSLMARASLGLVHLAPNAGSMQRLAESLELAKDAGDSTAASGILSRMALARLNEGFAEEAMQLATEAVHVSKNPIDLATNETIRALVHLAMGSLSSAEADIRDALREAEQNGLITVVAYAEKARASFRHMVGATNEAEAAYRSSVARCLEIGQKAMAAGVRSFLALLLYERNLTEACLAELREAAPLLDERYDPLKPPVLARAIEALARARLSGNSVDRSPFRTSRNAELGEVMERLDVLADLEDARRELTLAPDRGQGMARAALERFAILRGEGKLTGSVERAVIDSVVSRELATWENPAAKIAEQLVVNEGGDWFRTPGGPIVLCSHRPVLRRLLAKLGEARQHRRGAPVPVEELREVAWPDEKMSDSSARNRMKQSMAMLRKLGLHELLERKGNGYQLSVTVLFRLTSGWES